MYQLSWRRPCGPAHGRMRMSNSVAASLPMSTSLSYMGKWWIWSNVVSGWCYTNMQLYISLTFVLAPKVWSPNDIYALGWLLNTHFQGWMATLYHYPRSSQCNLAFPSKAYFAKYSRLNRSRARYLSWREIFPINSIKAGCGLKAWQVWDWLFW